MKTERILMYLGGSLQNALRWERAMGIPGGRLRKVAVSMERVINNLDLSCGSYDPKKTGIVLRCKKIIKRYA